MLKLLVHLQHIFPLSFFSTFLCQTVLQLKCRSGLNAAEGAICK